MKRLVYFAVDHPKVIILITALITLFFFLQFPRIKIDTDPENMLEEDQADRVFYDYAKKEFGIHDLIVLGITDEKGIFRPETLTRVARITDEILRIKGVIIEDVVSLTTTDNVKAREEILEIKPILNAQKIPSTPQELKELQEEIQDNPLLYEKVVSADGKATAVYIPIEKKVLSYAITKQIREICKKELGEGQDYYLAGLPLSEDGFGHEMFVQMGLTAPINGMFIFLLLLFLFGRRLSLIIPPMIVAMLSVIWGMGALIGLGYTVHIMSSMIPVFLMPIAVLDSIHLINEFYDRYPSIGEKKATIRSIFEELFTPMFYTSITTAVGFASLVLGKVPPVRVFGVFVALGVMIAWLLTITLIPASFALFINDNKLKARLGTKAKGVETGGYFLAGIGRFAYARNKVILLGAAILLAIGVWGISTIVVNDNPTVWFKPSHWIRIADRELNRLFGGTYTAYLVLEGKEKDDIKRPEIIGYVEALQKSLEELPVVGKTSSVADVVKQVNYAIHRKDPQFRRIGATQEENGQYLFLYLMSGDPNDIDIFSDYDYRQANIWVQMKRGENLEMAAVVNHLQDFMFQNPPPEGLKIRWSGLTYINKVWQDLMVVGMLNGVLGGFVAVFILMVILFRSLSLGLISMIPLTIAIVFTYGIVGFYGKNYDMPIAVCSSLALGLAIDFAIHFIQRFRTKLKEVRDFSLANDYTFTSPARAILKNAIVIAFGFIPLVFATLTPYQTVGFFFLSLMTFCAVSTFFVLPALIKNFGNFLFRGEMR